MISVIIPVYNEELLLRSNVKYFDALATNAEVIFVDGGSADATCEFLKRYPHLILGPKGRAVQMNQGAQIATHEILLFLHADTKIDIDTLRKIEVYINERNYNGGCLTQVIEKPGLLYKWISLTGNVRAKILKTFYGDQGIFVRKRIFEKMGGFPRMDIGEDIYFTRKLREFGDVDIFPDKIYCSARRWVQQGVFRTYINNLRVKGGLLLNHSQKRLANIYRDVR